MENNKPLADHVSDKLIQYIIDNDLHAGDKLPNEFSLAQLLGVGRSTIREAVKTLVSRNVLDVHQGAGTFVANGQIGISDDPLGFLFVRNKEKLMNDLMEIRSMIEPKIASYAATNATENEIIELEILENEIEHLIATGHPFYEMDREFHFKLAQYSGNIVAQKIIPVIQDAIFNTADDYGYSDNAQTIMESHQNIIDSIKSRDPVSASDMMYLHLTQSRLELKKHCKKSQK